MLCKGPLWVPSAKGKVGPPKLVLRDNSLSLTPLVRGWEVRHCACPPCFQIPYDGCGKGGGGMAPVEFCLKGVHVVVPDAGSLGGGTSQNMLIVFNRCGAPGALGVVLVMPFEQLLPRAQKTGGEFNPKPS